LKLALNLGPLGVSVFLDFVAIVTIVTIGNSVKLSGNVVVSMDAIVSKELTMSVPVISVSVGRWDLAVIEGFSSVS
jgi:hypothetical protein